MNTELHDDDGDDYDYDEAHVHDDDDDDDDKDHDDFCLRVEARAKRGEKTKTGNVWLDLNIIVFTI